MLRPALFLDRDGVINADHGYVHRPDDFSFVPGIFELARFAAADLGWPVVVITNQSGIGRGLFGEREYQELTRWMCARFAGERAPIARVYHCPYHPTHGIGAYRADHPWRKPRPGMILQAAKDLGLDLPGSALVGDGMRDIEAGAAAGVGLLVRLGAREGSSEPPHETVADLAEALALLRARCVSQVVPQADA
jgi:D-glycero-D-manno-heptose 1,7-bisphosphate phosphatase